MPITKGELYSQQTENTHRSMILSQIERCNRVMSSYDTSEEVVDEKLHKRTFMRGAAEGKSIALSVRVLLSLSRKVLPKKFFDNLRTENKYQAAFGKIKGVYPYLVEDPQVQYDAIMRIMTFYDELLAAIFSLEDFSDTKYLRENKLKTFGNDEEEDDLFEAQQF